MNSKEYLKQQIKKINPYDSIEYDDINNTLNWVDSGVEIYRIQKPDIPKKHLVSYFVLYDKIKKKMLLVDHKKAQLLLPTGGHVEVNEDPKDTACRECGEELGIEAKFLNGDNNPMFLTFSDTVGLTAGHTDVSIWYTLEYNSELTLNFSHEEFYNIHWLTIENILSTPIQKMDPNMYRFVNKFKKKYIN